MAETEKSRKSFAAIHEDYAFFESHTDESTNNIHAYAAQLATLGGVTWPIRLLDFGCGHGAVTERFLNVAGLNAKTVSLSIVEPDDGFRAQAIERLTPLSSTPIAAWPLLPPKFPAPFDLIVSHHVLYYVGDLAQTIRGLRNNLTPNGLLMITLAGPEHPLIEWWARGFELIGLAVPYHTAANLADTLQSKGWEHEIQKIHSRLAFPDTEEGRLSILRFLFGDYFPRMPVAALLSFFNPYSRLGQIDIPIIDDLFRIAPLAHS